MMHNDHHDIKLTAENIFVYTHDRDKLLFVIYNPAIKEATSLIAQT